MPDGITALAEKIGVESDESTTIAGVSMDDVDLDSLVNNVLCGFGEQSRMMLEYVARCDKEGQTNNKYLT